MGMLKACPVILPGDLAEHLKKLCWASLGSYNILCSNRGMYLWCICV